MTDGAGLGLTKTDAAAIREAVRQDRQRLVALRRKLHAAPELGWREIRTTALIAAELEGLGYTVTSGPGFLGDVPRLGLSETPVAGEGETGCIAVLNSGRPGPSVCLRVDIDALPIHEADSDHRPAVEGWASAEPGVMHACGHDGHAAIGLGVARALVGLRERLSGRLLLLFQPAEEGGRGASAVVDAGWMEKVDALLAVHLGLGLPSGSLALNVSGFLATRKFRAIIAGQSAHAGKEPEAGRNALLAACQATLALHAMAQSSDPGARVNVGRIRAGTTLNIVPAQAEMGFEIRASDSARLDALDRRCRAAVEHAAAAWGTEATVELRGEATGWRNDAALIRLAAAANRLISAFPAVVPRFDFGASEDATLLARAVAGHGGRAAIFVLGADLADGHHTPRFDFDEAVLTQGTMFLSVLIAGLLMQ